MDSITSVRLEYTASPESPNDIWVVVSGAILQGAPDIVAIGEALEPVVQSSWPAATFTQVTVTGEDVIPIAP